MSLQREVELQQRLHHPNIVEVFEVFESDEYLHLVMQRSWGGTLANMLKRERRLTPRVAATLLKQLLRALVYLHAQGVLHCDIKPENVLLDVVQDELGTAKPMDTGGRCTVKDAARLRMRLCDFGLARQVPQARYFKHSGSVHLVPFNGLSGTPGYISPEQLLHKP